MNGIGQADKKQGRYHVKESTDTCPVRLSGQ